MSPAPLAAYRIAFSLVVLLEFLHLALRRDLVFPAHPLRDAMPGGTRRFESFDGGPR